MNGTTRSGITFGFLISVSILPSSGKVAWTHDAHAPFRADSYDIILGPFDGIVCYRRTQQALEAFTTCFDVQFCHCQAFACAQAQVYSRFQEVNIPQILR